MHPLLALLAALSFLTASSLALPNGAPDACAKQPKHGSHKPQTSKNPYVLKVEPYEKDQRSAFMVTLSGGEEQFTGFLLTASKGNWSLVSKENGKIIEGSSKCAKSGVTHVDNSQKSAIVAKLVSNEEAEIKAFVVKDFKTFWTDLTANTKS